MIIKPILLILLTIVITSTVTAQLPKVLIMDAKRLADIKKQWQEKDVAILSLTDSLLKQANGYLKMKPVLYPRPLVLSSSNDCFPSLVN